MSKRILAVLSATFIILGLGSAPSAQAYTIVDLPVVERSVTCGGYAGKALFWFQQRSDNGTVRPWRGGWRMITTWNIAQVDAWGVVGAQSYNVGDEVNFNPDVQGASQYNKNAPFAHASYVSQAVAITLTDGTRCAVALPASAAL